MYNKLSLYPCKGKDTRYVYQIRQHKRQGWANLNSFYTLQEQKI